MYWKAVHVTTVGSSYQAGKQDSFLSPDLIQLERRGAEQGSCPVGVGAEVQCRASESVSGKTYLPRVWPQL